jgi:protein O-GlcNAc transferase
MSADPEDLPDPAEIDRLEALFSARRYADAEALARQMSHAWPNHGFTWKVLGTALAAQQRFEEALPQLRKALDLLPSDPVTHKNMGAVLMRLGRLPEAEASLRRALELKPDFDEAHHHLGNVLRDLGRLSEAEASYRRALTLKPDYPEAHGNLGATLHALGRLSEAEASYRRALELKPDYHDAHNNLAMALWARGRLQEAKASCRRALEFKPDYHEAHNNLGALLKELGRLQEAEASCRRALALKPDYHEAYNNLGNVLRNLGRLPEAEASYRRALTLKPDFHEAHSNLGTALHDLGRLSEAEASYRRALELRPDYQEASNSLLFCLSHSKDVDAQALFAEYCRFGEVFEAPLRAFWPRHANSRDPERSLRIGFVSGDLREHPVAYFIEPVLAQLANHPHLLLHAYYNHAWEDDVSRRLRRYLPHWHPVAGQSDAALAETIRKDGIDILVDLSGHTGEHRLLTFARKPAPVQASWIGYPGTSGLSAMDYYLTDGFFLPPGQFDAQFTEKLVRLPASAPYQPPDTAPPLNALPALENGFVTFGSFNRPNKLSPPVIALWAQLMRALPSARMVLGSMPSDGRNEGLIEWFAREGVAADRLSFYSRRDTEAYLKLYRQVDLCLDTFPFAGLTTTYHALWMGVPTLTLAGQTIAGRSGAGVLGHLGLDAFVAHDAADFVRKAMFWAADLSGLAALRASLRVRFKESLVGQPATVVAGVVHALRMMWQRWCAGLPAESFQVRLQDIPR